MARGQYVLLVLFSDSVCFTAALTRFACSQCGSGQTVLKLGYLARFEIEIFFFPLVAP